MSWFTPCTWATRRWKSALANACVFPLTVGPWRKKLPRTSALRDLQSKIVSEETNKNVRHTANAIQTTEMLCKTPAMLCKTQLCDTKQIISLCNFTTKTREKQQTNNKPSHRKGKCPLRASWSLIPRSCVVRGRSFSSRWRVAAVERSLYSGKQAAWSELHPDKTKPSMSFKEYKCSNK